LSVYCTRLGHSPVFALFVGTLLSLPGGRFPCHHVDKASGSVRWFPIGLICLSALRRLREPDHAHRFLWQALRLRPFLLFLNGLLKPIGERLCPNHLLHLADQIISVTKINVGPLTGPTDALPPCRRKSPRRWVVGSGGFQRAAGQDLISRTEVLLSARRATPNKDPGQ
jgi:hypothetical protein